MLNRAVSGLELAEERGKLIRNAIDLIDYPDTRIISLILNYDKAQKMKKDDVSKERINELVQRIKELEEFDTLKDSLLDKYKNELKELENEQ